MFENVARQLCAYAEEPSGANLTIAGKPNPIDGGREMKTYNCSAPETGEHKAQKLEREATRRPVGEPGPGPGASSASKNPSFYLSQRALPG